MTNEILSAFLQILVFSLIPLTTYLISHKKFSGFFQWIGLHKTTRKGLTLALITSLIFVAGGILLAIISPDIRKVLINPPSVTGKLRLLGFNGNSLTILLIIAWLKTSLSEEILFRGFMAKRLVSTFGMQRGNILQALTFAIVHVLVFWLATDAGIPFMIFIFILSGLAGYFIEYINEEYGNGSIIPGWIAHGLGNSITYLILAFII